MDIATSTDATTSLVGHCLPHHYSFISKQYRKALLLLSQLTHSFALPNGQLSSSDYNNHMIEGTAYVLRAVNARKKTGVLPDFDYFKSLI